MSKQNVKFYCNAENQTLVAMATDVDMTTHDEVTTTAFFKLLRLLASSLHPILLPELPLHLVPQIVLSSVPLESVIH